MIRSVVPLRRSLEFYYIEKLIGSDFKLNFESNYFIIIIYNNNSSENNYKSKYVEQEKKMFK